MLTSFADDDGMACLYASTCRCLCTCLLHVSVYTSFADVPIQLGDDVREIEDLRQKLKQAF